MAAGTRKAAGGSKGSAALGRRTPPGPALLALLVAALLAVLPPVLRRWGWLAPAAPGVSTFRIVKRYKHDPKAFTQGLLWANGSLYESLGLYGRSSIREVKLSQKGGYKVVREVPLGPQDFGEGLVHLRGELLQLLWNRPDGHRFAATAGEGGHLELLPEQGFRTPLQDGWGLASDGQVLFVTDGGRSLFHVDPGSFELLRTVDIHDGDRLVEMVNELEFIDGELWGNVFGQECLARVDPATGSVRGWVDLSGLLDRPQATADAKAKGLDPPDVLNGIAWDAETRRLFVTGKLWPQLFQIEVVPHPALSLEEARKRCIPSTNVFRRS